MDYSRSVVEIYKRYVSPDDILVYSVDEVVIDATHYLGSYKMTAHELTMTMIRDVMRETRISIWRNTSLTATAGIAPRRPIPYE